MIVANRGIMSHFEVSENRRFLKKTYMRVLAGSSPMVQIVLDKEIGQLIPVLLDARGRTIDGSHRTQRDKRWRTERLKHIDTEEKFLRARLLANDNRRVMEAEEIREILNELAQIYRKQGAEPGEIVKLVADKTGYSEGTVNDYLRAEFKDRQHRESALAGSS